MSLTRGNRSLFPCPRCLVPAEHQGRPSVDVPARTSGDSQVILQAARKQKYATDREDALKALSLRDVDVCYFPYFSGPNLPYPQQNVFWKIANSDPYAALSFDRLHTFPSGLFRHHLWPKLQAHVEALGREASVAVVARFAPPFLFQGYYSHQIKVLTVSHHGGDSPILETTSMRTLWMGPNGRTCPR